MTSVKHIASNTFSTGLSVANCVGGSGSDDRRFQIAYDMFIYRSDQYPATNYFAFCKTVIKSSIVIDIPSSADIITLH